jgi:hypothetical protein
MVGMEMIQNIKRKVNCNSSGVANDDDDDDDDDDELVEVSANRIGAYLMPNATTTLTKKLRQQVDSANFSRLENDDDDDAEADRLLLS